MKAIVKLTTILLLSIVLFSDANNITAQSKPKSVKIGEQVWTTENLNVDRFRNGDLIPETKTATEWITAGKEGKPAWCYYKNNPDNGKKYGKFYNWYAVNDKRGLAPEGWHVATETEFETLITSVNKNSNTLKALGEGEGDGAGTNTSGFSALLAGYRNLTGNFVTFGSFTNFWSSTENSTANARLLNLYSDNSNLYFFTFSKAYGYSVRCLKD